MTRSANSLSHSPAFERLGRAMLPDSIIEQHQRVAQSVTDDGKLRADRLDGWVPPHAIPLEAIERGILVDIDPPSIAAGAVASIVVDVPGARENDVVQIGPPSGLNAALVPLCGIVTGDNEVTIKLMNTSGGSLDGLLRTWRVVLVR